MLLRSFLYINKNLSTGRVGGGVGWVGGGGKQKRCVCGWVRRHTFVKRICETYVWARSNKQSSHQQAQSKGRYARNLWTRSREFFRSAPLELAFQQTQKCGVVVETTRALARGPKIRCDCNGCRHHHNDWRPCRPPSIVVSYVLALSKEAPTRKMGPLSTSCIFCVSTSLSSHG